MQPLISVITTLYNCNKYVSQSLESILSQTYKNFEFVIINDGSTDSTVEKINSFKDNRIIFIDNKDNKGIAIRRNEAISKSCSKYICVHDGDDISLPDRLEKQCDFLENNDSIFCVGSHAIKINESGEELEIMNYPPQTHDEIVEMLRGGILNPIIDPSSMYRLKDFNALGGYTLNKKRHLVPDMDLWLRAIMYKKLFANLQLPLIKYRMNPDGMTQKHKMEMIYEHVNLILNSYFLISKRKECSLQKERKN
jgi:glycosyltransferase involved in cell wall biosynthesis